MASNWIKIWRYYITTRCFSIAMHCCNIETQWCQIVWFESHRGEGSVKSGILSSAKFSHQTACNAHRGGNNKLTALRLVIYCRHLQWVPCPPPLFLSLASLVPLAPSLEDGSHWPGTCKAYHLCSWTPSWGLKEEVEFLELPKAIIMITIIITVNRLQSWWLLSIKWNNSLRTFRKRKVGVHVSFYDNRVFVTWVNVFRAPQWNRACNFY